ncbi:MAG: hypothetical protein ACD_29C00295G0002 [uncultured bacterium]|nr:MAG: hypothetical protein ACD_29C00295G0002 [uncultured bacterium]OGT25933.1 MAG: methyltransferase [Gammaproteobacteria bacterium RIFCSPHIGHO2_02_FULL_42_43]OGT52317.1 MAG: methyltransferase [Gammaproteobacteria bacterium RIFCSPHIGHO2_12_FULL_41_25]OGT61929.1 MAG: methyltransferase [Gammaproteobacteria bacterium RIFCSPLOWO2_02_FULL_42_14]OGT86360.1 MAG: methyltransferase [Gammaproteobacteria bacterium RIFCSPLOWO2_12_FULL_42_18]
MEYWHTPDASSALQAKEEALKIACYPVVFQCTYALWKLGVIGLIGEHGEHGIDAARVAAELNLSVYGVKVLLDLGLSCKLVWLNGDNYVLDKVGHFILCDSMVQVNIDFIQNVCYQGLFSLLDAIKSGKPEGLKLFGEWETIYPALSTLPKTVKDSWFAFDHYYSDKAFPVVLPLIFSKPVHQLLDVGGNTGKWAIACLKYNPNVRITIADLPEQLIVAQKNMVQEGFSDRVDEFEIDLLDPTATLPRTADVIWMSQFLDCFSEEKILSILQRAADVMDRNTSLYILELFWDRQTYRAAEYTINCTSIYFTCMANGNSRMYHSKDMIKLIHQANLYIDEDIDHIGAGHTLLCCKKKNHASASN